MRIAFATLGCKINQYETDLLRHDVLSRGGTIVPFDDKADVYIINTCSVTAKSDTQCRQKIRSAIRRNSGAKVIVTGCYAETQPDEIIRIPGIELVVGNHDKSTIPDRIMPTADAASCQDKHPPMKGRFRALHHRTRGFLKIQDGCDNRCSYCIVPLARGRSRSVPPQDVTREFERLARAGSPEVVLTGIHIGKYGSDLGTKTTLTDMVRMLLSSRGRTRIRLSSIEPKEITEELIGFLGKGLCRHLHIPLQSGDDGILASMKRNYTSGFYQALLKNIYRQVPGIALGADVMVGFPGEGENEFLNTMRLVEESPLTHLHVFSYSPRPGTPAADMRDQVPEQVKKNRREALRLIGKKKNLDFRNTCLGAELCVVVEDKVDVTTGLYAGLTDNYIRVWILGSKTEHIGKEIKVRITDVKEEENFATIM